MKDFYNEYHLEKYPNIIAGIDTAFAVSDYFEISGVPYIAIYGKNKKLSKTFEGKIYSSQIKKQLKNNSFHKDKLIRMLHRRGNAYHLFAEVIYVSVGIFKTKI
ncbi:hypothetical protein [Paraflavitalea speifideaquila]|uniref:hypothetical protein n=1 Tax=Paraflavitalea speifideaquila TaxID=3076558 RepID=UPI0028EED8BA|nr:hypothetical protein [Paraflavitalea speifideiaquila]